MKGVYGLVFTFKCKYDRDFGDIEQLTAKAHQYKSSNGYINYRMPTIKGFWLFNDNQTS